MGTKLRDGVAMVMLGRGGSEARGKGESKGQ